MLKSNSGYIVCTKGGHTLKSIINNILMSSTFKLVLPSSLSMNLNKRISLSCLPFLISWIFIFYTRNEHSILLDMISAMITSAVMEKVYFGCS